MIYASFVTEMRKGKQHTQQKLYQKDTLLECEDPVRQCTMPLRGLLRCQGVFPNKSRGENEICFTHVEKGW